LKINTKKGVFSTFFEFLLIEMIFDSNNACRNKKPPTKAGGQ